MNKTRPFKLLLTGIKILFVTLVVIVLNSCSEKTKYERTLKNSIKQYLNENLKDPSSLKDLEITYAILSQKEINNFYEKQHKEYIEKPLEVKSPIKVRGEAAIVMIQYRAKNSFGAYNKEIQTFRYWYPLPYPDALKSIDEHEAYLFDAILKSSNKKVIK